MRRQGTKELQKVRKQQNGNSKFLSINTYFRCKWIKFSNEGTEWLMDKKQDSAIC